MALDESGDTLREAMRQIGMEVPPPPPSTAQLNGGSRPVLPQLKIGDRTRGAPRKPGGSGNQTSVLPTRSKSKSSAGDSSASSDPSSQGSSSIEEEP